MPLPEAPQDVADLIFTPDPEEFTRPVLRRTAPQPRPASDILAELSRPRLEPAAPVEAKPAQPEISAEEREALIGSLFAEIVANPEAAFRPVRSSTRIFSFAAAFAASPDPRSP